MVTDTLGSERIFLTLKNEEEMKNGQKEQVFEKTSDFCKR